MSWFSNLLGPRTPAKNPRRSSELSFKEAVEIAAAYGDLAQSPDFPAIHTSTADTKMLPYPKSDIKAALRLVLEKLPAGKSRDSIEFIYCMLACFQDGVGPVNAGVSLAEIMSPVSSQAEAAQFAEKLQRQNKWDAVATAEYEVLLCDLGEINAARTGRPN
jgi:hypothetical protein